MKQKLDFIIEDNGNKRIIFRFYPRRSHCHSFNENPPTSWEEVYKVYYSYSILRQYKWDKNSNWESKVMFKESCDEDSIIHHIGFCCMELSKGYITYELVNGERANILDELFYPFGNGTSWEISNVSQQKKLYRFELFDWQNIGYKFFLPENRLKEFGDYLDNCCEYMLKHGERI